MVHSIGVEQRRARLGRRHLMAPSVRAESVVEVGRSLVALHGTDPATVFLSALARLRVPEVGAVEQALYDDRSLIRMLGMRRTVFTVPVELAPVVHAGCTLAVAARLRRGLVQDIEKAGIAADGGAWLAEVEQATLRVLAARGEAAAGELAADEPRLKEKLIIAAGKSYAATPAVASRLIGLLAADGHIVRGRPRGTWISNQFQWHPVRSWLPDGLAELTPAAAQAELVRQWLGAFGPGTAADLKWWTGLNGTEVKRAVAAVGAVEVELDGGTGLVLPDDLEPVLPTEPWAALLPSLDPTAMGWVEREWYLGGHGPVLFDRTGNIGPTVWWEGRIVGGWAQHPSGEIRFRLLEDIGADGQAAVQTEAERMSLALGAMIVVPRFRTPLERELAT